MRTSPSRVYFLVTTIALSTACTVSKNNAGEKSPPQSVLTISFQKSMDFKEPLPPYGAVFEITEYHSSPGGVSNETGYLYTDQKFCLKGTAVPKPGEVESNSSEELRDTITFCFSINDYVPYKLIPDPIRPAKFPIGKWRPGTLINQNPSEVTFVRLELREHYGNTPVPRARTVGLMNNEASGMIQITSSEKNRLVGTVDVSDGNLSVVGKFDCPLR